MKIFQCYRENPFRRLCPIAILLLFVLFFFVVSTTNAHVVYAQTANKTKVYGYVFDYVTRQPISGAQIGAINESEPIGRRSEYMYMNEQQQGIIAETNASGFFEAYVDSSQMYIFYVYYDNMSTPGVDYVPEYREVSIQNSPYYLTFSLLPGASINATENPFFSFDESVFSYEIFDQAGLLELTNSLRNGWESRSEIRYGNMVVPANMGANRTIIVPANTGVQIRIDLYRVAGTNFGYPNFEQTANFSIPLEGGYLNLTQGEQVVIDLKNARLEAESSIDMPKLVNSTKSLAGEIGILSSYQKVRISSAEDLLGKAQASMSSGDYVGAQANLYESYLTLTDVRADLSSLFQNSVLSIYFITPFIGLTSSSLGAIFFKDRLRRIIISIGFFVFFVMMLFFAYPGYTFVQNPSYNPLSGTFLASYIIPLLLVLSFLLGLVLINGPYTYGEKTDRRSLSVRSAIVATFSLAVDNLKRRKLRTFLTMLFMLISVFAFIILTSYSSEQGFMVIQKSGTPPSEGIFVFQQAVNPAVLPFGPVESQIVQWLSRRPEVELTIPLLKNVPQMGTPPPPLGFIFNANSSLNYTISGVLGIEPSLEINLTKIDRIISTESGAGRFLDGMDLNGIVISKEVEEALHVGLNDTVRFCDKNFTVIGIFDSGKLGSLKDLNGDPIIPQEVRVLRTQGGLVYLPNYVASEKVIIMLSEDASKLPLNIVVSRVDVQTKNSGDIFSLARELVLLFPRVETYVSMNSVIQHLSIGFSQVTQGFAESTVLLVLMVLNVGMMMLNVVYERRREVVILSTVGLNPSQVTAIFAVEALVMAFIAGSLGYLLGMTSYIFLGYLPSPPILKFKVEASWSILALCFSISASVFGSVIPASKASVLATPSLLRRFIVSSRERSREGAWTLDIPVKIKEKDIRQFFDFIEERLKVYSDPLRFEERADNIVRQKEIYGPSQERIYFVYKFSVNKIITENELFSAKDAASDEYFIKLASKSLLPWNVVGKEASARQTASFIRRLTLEFTERERT